VNVSIWTSLNSPPSSRGQPTELKDPTTPDGAVEGRHHKYGDRSPQPEAYQQLYDNFAAGNIPAVLAAFAADIYWHVPEPGPLSGDYRGPAEVLGFFEHFLGLADEGSFSIRIDDVLAKRDRVIVLCNESATRNGRSWSSLQVHAWTIRDGGRRACGDSFRVISRPRTSTGPDDQHKPKAFCSANCWTEC